MKRIVASSLVIALGLSLAVVTADEPMQLPEPQGEHRWLRQLEGEWDVEGEVKADPSKPAIKTRGTESTRLIGDFWSVGEIKSEFEGKPFTGVLTLGYDPEKKKFVGTWIDSMTPHAWQYEGELDKAGKTLTLMTEGPCPQSGGKIVKIKETLEITDKDHKLFTSQREENGQWITGMTLHYTRRAPKGTD